MHFFSKELKFIIRVVGISSHAHIDHSRYITDESPYLNWEIIRHLVSFHEIRPLFLNGLEKTILKNFIPNKDLQKLKEDCKKITLRSLYNHQELLNLLKELKKNNITAIPYKGTILSQQLYTDSFLRETSDIDLFILKEEVEKLKLFFRTKNIFPEYDLTPKLEKWLLRINCELNYSYVNKNGIAFYVEPHHKSSHAMEAINLFLEDIIDQTEIRKINGVDLKVFTFNATLLLMILNNGITERWEKLKYLLDLHQLITNYSEEIDWEWLNKMLVKHDLSKVFFSGLLVLHTLFNTPIPTKLKSKCNSPIIRRLAKERIKFISEFEKVTLRSEWKSLRYRIKIRTSLSNKLKILYKTLSLPTRHDLVLLNRSALFRYFFLIFRPLRIINNYLLPKNKS